MSDHVKIHGIKPRIQYVADGSSTTYEFPFAIFSTSDINVYFGTVLQDATTYTVTEARQSDGGSVTFGTAPISGTIITILRQLSVERTTDFQEGGALRADTLNDELDYQIACQQQIAENLNRAMVLPPYAADNNLNLALPLPSAGKAIVWNSAGTNLENSTIEVNALESTLNTYKTEAHNSALTSISKAATATDKAELATTQAGIATTQAGIAATKAAEAASAANQLNGLRTNCVTKIPQDIKLELNSGTLTLKSGSKYYKCDGSFTAMTTTQDFSTTPTTNGTYFVFFGGDGFALYAVADCKSGSSDPGSGSVWLNTSTMFYTPDQQEIGMNDRTFPCHWRL